MNKNLNAFPITPKSGNEPFTQNGNSLDTQLIDFWRWANSDLSNNVMRGILAEYIVAYQLGITSGVRLEWDAFDLETKDGVKIEIKSSAYLQSWGQEKLSKIIFDIAPKDAWDAKTNTSSGIVKRHADVYIFCVLHHKDKATLDPLNLDQWTFYLLATKVLNDKIPTQKTIVLSSLLKLNPIKASYDQIEVGLKEIVSSF